MGERMKDYIPILAALIVAIPVSFTIALISPMMSQANIDAQNPNMNDHLMLLKLENQSKTQNDSINNISNFLLKNQIPLDCRAINVTDSIQHCINVLNGGR